MICLQKRGRNYIINSQIQTKLKFENIDFTFTGFETFTAKRLYWSEKRWIRWTSVNVIVDQ